jgi:putative methionine-R-sulfoxide reductase with GAF domain
MFAEAGTVDLIQTLIASVKEHPIYPGIGILIICTLFGLSFLKPLDVLKSWWEQRKDERLQSANEAIEKLTEIQTWLRLALDVSRDSVERANRLRIAGTWGEIEVAMVHLGDWAQRLFGFLEADINKVTMWVSDGQALRVAVYNGMQPESAKAISLSLSANHYPKPPFAILAYQSRLTQVCSDIDTDPRYAPLSQAATHPYKSIIAVPMIVGSSIVGVLTVDSLRVGRFDDESARQLAQLCASLLALYYNSPDWGAGPSLSVPPAP